MPATIEPADDNVYILNLTGVLKKSEFGETQTAMAQAIDTGTNPRLLVMLEKFEGWERGADWNDLDFLFEYSNEIEKIAIVGEKKWETPALAFAGAGFRRAPVMFFPSNQIEEARRWIKG